MAEILALAARVSADAGLGPVGRLVRDLDERERQAQEQLHLLSQPIAEPAALERLRGDRQRAAARLNELKKALAAAETARGELDRRRPSLWSWITGLSRSHKAEVQKVEVEVARISKVLNNSEDLYAAATGRLKRRKTRWKAEKDLLEGGRVAARKAAQEELAWIARARICVKRDPSLSVSPDRLTAAVQSEERKIVATVSFVPRSGYRFE